MSKTNYPGPDPEWDEIGRLANHLKAGSRPWIGARTLVFIALIVMARLSLAEATAMRISDVDLISGRIRVGRREQFRDIAATSSVSICQPLAEILGRWIPRVRSEYLFPNQTREGPWETNNAHTGTKPHDLLRAACNEASVRAFTLRSLRLFGERQLTQLADPDGSPFRIDRGDSVTIIVESIPLTRLREAVEESYEGQPGDGPRVEHLRRIRLAFEVLGAIKGVSSSGDIAAPGFFERCATAAGVVDIATARDSRTMRTIHNICSHAIRIGCLDLDPFSGRPGFVAKGRWHGPPRQNFPNGGGRPKVDIAKVSPGDIESEIAKLTAKRAKVARALIDAEPIGLTGAGIYGATHVPGWWKMLKAIQESAPFWQTRVLFPPEGKTCYRIKVN